jgi:predicted nucleic acid-binding protein
MYQVVIDTNVLVAALLSNRGASHRLLRLVGDDRWRMDLSVPLVFEYEQTLKRVCACEALRGSDIDGILHFLCAKDFAGAERFGIRVIPPREFLAIIGEAP